MWNVEWALSVSKKRSMTSICKLLMELKAELNARILKLLLREISQIVLNPIISYFKINHSSQRSQQKRTRNCDAYIKYLFAVFTGDIELRVFAYTRMDPGHREHAVFIAFDP